MPAIKIRGLRWWMIGLLMPGSTDNYLTRSALAVVRLAMPLDPASVSEKRALERDPARP